MLAWIWQANEGLRERPYMSKNSREVRNSAESAVLRMAWAELCGNSAKKAVDRKKGVLYNVKCVVRLASDFKRGVAQLG